MIGEIKPSPVWTSQRLEWVIENKHISREMNEDNKGYELLQGKGIAQRKTNWWVY